MTVPKMNCEWIHWSIIQNWRRKNKTKTKQKTKTTENRTPSVQRRNNLYNLQWKRNLYRWIPKAFQGRVTHDRKCLQSLKQKKTWTKHVVLNYIVNKILPLSSVSPEARGDSSQLPWTKGHSFEASKMVSCLSIRADLELNFHTFHSNTISKSVASIQIFDLGKGTKYFWGDLMVL